MSGSAALHGRGWAVATDRAVELGYAADRFTAAGLLADHHQDTHDLSVRLERHDGTRIAAQRIDRSLRPTNPGRDDDPGPTTHPAGGQPVEADDPVHDVADEHVAADDAPPEVTQTRIGQAPPSPADAVVEQPAVPGGLQLDLFGQVELQTGRRDYDRTRQATLRTQTSVQPQSAAGPPAGSTSKSRPTSQPVDVTPATAAGPPVETPGAAEPPQPDAEVTSDMTATATTAAPVPASRGSPGS